MLIWLFSFAPIWVQAAPGDAGVRSVRDPPGLVRVKGGKSQIGCETELVRKLMAETGSEGLAAETPLHEVTLEDYWLMVGEATNEQYVEFVRASGRRPPMSWAAAALEAAQARHVEEQSKKRAREGSSAPASATEPFAREAWWRDNWEGASWSLPPQMHALPVVMVDHQDAREYARWAGLRLQSEAEFQHAGRARSTAAYPWGETWIENAAATWERQVDRPAPVGSFPAGRTREGIYDLSGNVWEWTASPFAPFPGFKPVRAESFKGGLKRVYMGDPSWDVGWRVVVGGAFDAPRLAARLSTRVGKLPRTATESLGLRCALSARRGQDLIDDLLATVLTSVARTHLGTLARERALLLERWKARDGRATPAGYAVITGHDAVLAVPVERLRCGSEKGLAELAQAQGGCVVLGFLHTSVPVTSPKLPAGTWLIAWQARSETAAGSDAFVFLDLQGLEQARAPYARFRHERRPPVSPGSPASRPKLRPWDSQEAAPVSEPLEVLDLPLLVPGNVSGKAFEFELELEFERGRIDASWWGFE